MKFFIRLFFISILLLSAFNAFGATINVPGDYATIQSAIDNAPDGSVIIVAPGTYTEDLSCRNLNKTLYLKSSTGAASTIINGGGVRTLLTILNAPYGGRDVTFDGFTFIQGRGVGNFSPVTIGDAGPSFLNCNFDYNSSPLKGGAVVIFGASASPTFINCKFRHNQSNRFGGAVLVNGNSAQASFKLCSFEDNTNSTPNASNVNSGGALQFTEAGGTVLSCTFSRNSSTYTGGAVMIYTGDYSHAPDQVTISDCQFTDNFCLPGSSLPPSPTEGGAIHMEANVIVGIRKCYFYNNYAMSGGAINNYRAQLTISNSVFDNNRAVGTDHWGYGGAIGVNSHNPTSTDLPDATLTVTNTMIRNCLAPVGGGISFGGNCGWNLPDYRRGQITLNNVVIENCRATKANNSYGNGGALNLDFANFTANGVYLLNNTAEAYGGGILVNQNTLITLNNSFIIGNYALGAPAGASIHVATDNLMHPTSPSPILNNTVKAYNHGAQGDTTPSLAVLAAIPGIPLNGSAYLAYILSPYAGSPSISPHSGGSLTLTNLGSYAAGTTTDPISSNTTYQLTSSQPTQHVTVNVVSPTPASSSAVNDFNGDKKSDILWRHAVTGQLYIWLMNGTDIASQGSPATISDLNWEIKGVGDFNGDGKADILWRHKTSGQTFVWLMNGPSIASQGSPYTISDLGWEIKGVGDFNGDGKSDILWRHAVTGQLYIWLMDGTGIVSQGSPATISDLNWEIKGVGDFNGDGKADILWRHKTSGQTFVWLMNGLGIASQGSPYTVSDQNWEIKGVGDFNGDGKADILWRNAITGQVYVWLMDGPIISSQDSPGTFNDMNWEINGVGDYDGDGKASILWRHAGSGQMKIWQMEGTSLIFTDPAGIVNDLNWRIK